MVTVSKKKWMQTDEFSEEMVKELSQKLNKSELFIKICLQRGLDTVDKINEFITIDESWFHDPFLMHDMEKTVERIVQALENFEKITVYGDYDADGMTSTALLTETLDSLGANVAYYLPNRFTDGYGPNIEAFKKIIEEGTSLIITVDNGVAGHEAIDFASKQGVDVIITDHHELPEVLPNAYAVIHPKHPAGDYPFKELAGVGVTLKLATALIGDVPVELLDLAAIGTVADLVPLVDENRAIVYFGLQMLQNTQRTGLLHLLKIMDQEQKEIDEDTIGFQIAPRLNAVGRLGEASPCVELLVTHDPDVAYSLAEFVDTKNIERKAIVDKMTTSAFAQLTETNEAFEVNVLADENWHQGVLGIVASRIVDKTNKPTLLFTKDTNTGVAKGSARSIDAVNLYEAFTEINELFIQFGGHHMAAGMSAEISNLPTIQDELSKVIRGLEDKESYQLIDAYVPIEELTIESIKELKLLQPFGTANVKPIIACQNVSVIQKRKVGAEGHHLKLVVENDENQLDIISFQNGKVSDVLHESQEIDVAGYVEINEWNGFSKPQMQMIDMNIPGPVYIDQRASQLTEKHFQVEQADYIFYNKETFNIYNQYVPSSSKAVLLATKDDIQAFESNRELVVVDCPDSINQFKYTIENKDKNSIRCYFYKKNHLYLAGLPTREDFAKAYKYLVVHPKIDLQKEGHLLVQQLGMDSKKVFLIVKVFLEAKFVILDDGLLNIVNNPEKRDLKNTNAYKQAHHQMLAEELFLYSSFNEMIMTIQE